jgi:hypothetical protein
MWIYYGTRVLLNSVGNMQYDVKTPAEYLAVLEPDWRKDKLPEVRALFRKHAPEMKEGIKYGMLHYTGAKSGEFYLNAQKNSVNFYVGDIAKIDPDGTILAGFDIGKGCIRRKKLMVIAKTRFPEFVARTCEMWRAGEDSGCGGAPSRD